MADVKRGSSSSGDCGLRKALKALLISCGALGFAACASTSSLARVSAPQIVRSADRFEKEYVLATEDQIEIVVQRMPEVSRLVVIRPDGRISLPLLDDVQAAGLTFSELDARLTERFAARLVNPDVSVIGVKVRPAMVYVAGEVTNPSAVPLAAAQRAAEAITLVGGFRRSASTSNVTIIRLNAEGYLEAIPIGGPAKGDAGRYLNLALMPLEADDIIFVPESGRSKFTSFLDDFVNRPLSGVSSVFSGFVNWRVLRELREQ